VDDVVNAIADLHMTLGAIHLAREAAERNHAWTPENRVLIVSKESEKQKARTLQRLDRAHNDLKNRIAHVEGELSRPVQQAAASGPLSVELRAHAKSLDRAGREKLLSEALEAGDDATLHAVLGAQAFLSGLSRFDHAQYVHRYNTQKNPQLVARHAVMTTMLEKIYQAGPIIHAQFERAVGASPSVANTIRTANEQALAALDIKPTV
jgi:hypothetical protein